LGSVGLPLSRAFVHAGFTVLGFDRDHAKVARLARGENTLLHLEPGFVSTLLATRRFEPTSDADRLSEADIALIAVPTPLSPRREPDLECVRTAAHLLASSMRPGCLVVLESTSYPGTTRAVVGDIFRAAGRDPGRDCWLAYSPEREDPGRRDLETTEIAKLVGGTCARSSELAWRLYRCAFARVERTSSAEVAEAAKLLENTFRAVNIALVNELKIVLDALAIDVWEVIDAAATKPFGFMKFTPGPGLGGHCIPIDPHYLEHVAREAGASSRLIALASEINRSMPVRVVERTRAALLERAMEAGGLVPRTLDRGSRSIERESRTIREERPIDPLCGARVLVLGLAYKPGVDIVTESPALELIDLFSAAGADVEYSDPFVPLAPRSSSHAELDPFAAFTPIAPFANGGQSEKQSTALRWDVELEGGTGERASIVLSGDSISSFDAVVVATDHAEFDWGLVARHARLVIDTRHALASRMRGRPNYVSA
jgi:UDP-N-acetyl-D-glucosamine dehydrogenase